MEIQRLDHISLYVVDLDRSQQWYQSILRLEPRLVEEWWSKGARFLGSGDAMVALFQKPEGDTYRSEGMPIGNHSAFRVSRKAWQAYKERLAEQGIAFRKMNHKLSESIYFQDPDGYWIELTTYEMQP